MFKIFINIVMAIKLNMNNLYLGKEESLFSGKIITQRINIEYCVSMEFLTF